MTKVYEKGAGTIQERVLITAIQYVLYKLPNCILPITHLIHNSLFLFAFDITQYQHGTHLQLSHEAVIVILMINQETVWYNTIP